MNQRKVILNYYASSNKAVTIVVPESWKLIGSDSLEFAYSTPPHTKSDYFQLTVNKKHDLLENPTDYLKYFVQHFHVTNDSIYGDLQWERSVEKARELHRVESGGKGVENWVLVTESDDYILDFTYAYSGEQVTEAEILFDFICYTININGIPIFPQKYKLREDMLRTIIEYAH